MRVMQKTGLLILLLVAVLFVQDADALLLPPSTYGQAEGWEGSSLYDKDDYSAFIEFTVYETADKDFDWTADVGSDDFDQYKYIYAYQIYNFEDDPEIGYFALEDLSGELIAEDLMHNTTGQERTTGGEEDVAPTPLESQRQGVWTFEGSALIAGKRSWFLILCSDSPPMRGDFRLRPPTTDTGGFVPSPEPSTIALLGLGSTILFTKRRRPA